MEREIDMITDEQIANFMEMQEILGGIDEIEEEIDMLKRINYDDSINLQGISVEII